MKIKLILFFLLVFFNLYAQEEKTQIIKFNLSSIPFGAYGLSYEKVLGKRFSTNLSFNYRPKRLVPYVRTFEKLTNFADTQIKYVSLESLKKGETEVGLMSFSPEIRYYFGKKTAPIGTYISVFGKVNYFPTKVVGSLEIPYKSLNVVISMPIDTKVATYSGGLMLGKQFQIGKRFTLDWYIVGGHYGKITIDGQSEIDLAGYDEDFRLRLENKIIYTFQINTDYLGVNVDEKGVKIQNNQRLPYLNLRGFGFNFGYKF